ncbi:MAG: carboxypeptidase-like regulatory domain-containing protein [Pirellulaceae bacterium]
MSRSSWIHWSLAAGLLLFVGCGEKSIVDTVPVTGLVTLDGAPVAGATVSFSPTEKTGRAAVGTTDASGKFTLTTINPGDGAAPGTYGVMITKMAASSAAPWQDPRSSGGKLTPEQEKEVREQMASGEKAVAPQSELPQKYASVESSGFTATVSKDKTNDFTFAMTK